MQDMDENTYTLSEMKVAHLCSTLLRPHELYSPWNSPGQNTGMGSLSLLQGIFPTQGSNLGLLHCRRILYQLSYKGNHGCSSWIRKGRGTRDQIANICWIIEKARKFQKSIYFFFIDYAKAFDCVDHKNTVENSERDGNTRPPDLLPEKSVCRSRSKSLNWTWNNRLVPNRKRSTSSLYIVTLLI